MSNVYYKKISNGISDLEKGKIALQLLKDLIKKEKITLEKDVGLKVHFGEKGNFTYLKSKNYSGIINFLKEKKLNPKYIETNVLYKSERTLKDSHIKLAKRHGFNQIPIIIADGEHGENFKEVSINKKHFKSCKIGGEMINRQLLVVAHFKGHMLAGFGGAIKQLGMGCASRAGKLEVHSASKPMIDPVKCKKCGICKKNCPVHAISLKLIPRISQKKCIGCATCIAVCSNKAVRINWGISSPKKFYERLVEYAYAAQKGKKHIYINFVCDVTDMCDCMNKKMKPIIKDLGIFASTDAVAIDKACLDLIKKREKKKVFKSKHTIFYANEINLGSDKYNLIKI